MDFQDAMNLIALADEEKHNPICPLCFQETANNGKCGCDDS